MPRPKSELTTTKAHWRKTYAMAVRRMEITWSVNMVKESAHREQKKQKFTEPKILSQEELLKWWPFRRVDGRSLEKLQKQEVLKHSEDALI
jgi:hypothetical protein